MPRASRRCGGGRWPTRSSASTTSARSPALLALAKEPHPYTRAFAAKGLGGLKDASAVPTLLGLLASNDPAVVIESVRALGRIGDPSAAPALLKLVQAKDTNPHVRLEALDALGGDARSRAFPTCCSIRSPIPIRPSVPPR